MTITRNSFALYVLLAGLLGTGCTTQSAGSSEKGVGCDPATASCTAAAIQGGSGAEAKTVAAISHAWYGKFVPGRTRSGEVANAEHLARRGQDAYPPWSVAEVKDTWLQPGKRVYMVNLRSATAPGGWATSRQFTRLAEARKDLALLMEFKPDGADCCVLQQYIVKAPIPVREGYAGPLTARTPPHDSYPGGGPQWELLLDRSLTQNGGWLNFLIKGEAVDLR